MEMQNQKILEALRMQPLSEEEKASRHILGRLYGPIATCVESTRNGRLYNKPLWEKALVDEIFLEKVATKALFLELGHPADREETDMKQACACIPEVPKIVGDDLYAYVDILDTPNGRLLKTLVDYGFVPGISSRGSGDVLPNDQVDPETFFLETWDIVQLPAVKKARLNVCESLDTSNIKLQKALTESYNVAKEEDKTVMKQALENLNINIDGALEEAVEIPTEETAATLTADDIPWSPDEEETGVASADDELLVEDAEETAAAEPATEEAEEIEVDPETAVEETTAEEPAEEVAAEPTEKTVEEPEEEPDGELGKVVSKDQIISKLKGMLEEHEAEDIEVTFKPVIIADKEYEVTESTYTIDENIITISVSCAEAEPAAAEEEEGAETYIAGETGEEISDESSELEVEVSDTADDDGDAEIIESLKDAIRQKEALETEVSDLRNAKSVGDAKERELQEKLDQYRTAFTRMSAEAEKKNSGLESQIQELTEQLAQSKTTIQELTEKVNNARQLKESTEVAAAKVRKLTEQVNKLTQHSSTLEAQLEDQTKQYTTKLQERTNLAKAYKKRCIETLNRYVESKASMLGVKPSEITSRLNENYTLSDVDAVCDQILDSAVGYGRLPFGGRQRTSARISESVNKPTAANTFSDPSYGYDIDDSLLELAGLKK